MERNSLVIILNDIRSTLNVGAILRTADAVLVEKVYLCGITATPKHPKVSKTSLGAENYVSWEHVNDINKLIDVLKKDHYQVVGLELDQKAVSFWEAKYKKKMALIVGNEVEGIPNKIIKLCDLVIKIPMFGQKESLNVATAVGIATYEIIRKLKK
jgi:tRNA G18 (ribose-2'-O)-methylase SpoU